MGYIAETVRRFYHPAAADEMLSTFLPLINGTNLNVSDYYSYSCCSPAYSDMGSRAFSLRNTICYRSCPFLTHSPTSRPYFAYGNQ